MGESKMSETMMTSSSSTSPCESENEELQRLEHAPPFWRNPKKVLSKQLSMCETPRDIAWERRRRQILRQERRKEVGPLHDINDDLEDEDLDELKGCIELGFGFNEEQGGQSLCNTLPALDLYFAVNRQLSFSPILSPSSRGSSGSPACSSSSLAGSSSSKLLVGRSSSFGSPRSEDSWKICSPGDVYIAF